MSRLPLAAVLLGLASPALAHSGAHLHPHDGAHWLGVVAALGLITLAGGLAVARARGTKQTRRRDRK